MRQGKLSSLFRKDSDFRRLVRAYSSRNLRRSSKPQWEGRRPLNPSPIAHQPIAVPSAILTDRAKLLRKGKTSEEMPLLAHFCRTYPGILSGIGIRHSRDSERQLLGPRAHNSGQIYQWMQEMTVQAKLSKASRKKAKTAYKKVLKQAQNNPSAKKQGCNATEYFLYDLGNGGMPELFVGYPFPFRCGFGVFDFASGKAHDLGMITMSSRSLYAASKGRLHACGGFQGMYSIDKVSKSSGKIRERTVEKYVAKSERGISTKEKQFNARMKKMDLQILKTTSISSYSTLNSWLS